MVLVTISDILDIVGDFKRPLIEGEQLLVSKMLLIIGKIQRLVDADDNKLKVWALYLQSAGIFSNPHEINVELSLTHELSFDLTSVPNRVTKLSCSCKAGTSEKCKHAVAVLMHLNKVSEEDLEQLSSTDLEQQWGKLKQFLTLTFEAIPLCEYESIEKPSAPIYSRGIPVVPEDEAARNAKLILADIDDFKCEFSYHSNCLRAFCIERNSQRAEEEALKAEKVRAAMALTDKLLQIPPSQILNDVMAKCNEKISKLPSECLKFYSEHVMDKQEDATSIARDSASQTESRWFTERRLRITGSKCYGLYTYASNKNPDWEKKMKSVFEPSFKGNAATVKGKTCEIIARDLYDANKKVKVIENGLYVNPILPWLGFSADGVIVDYGNNPLFLLEIKSPYKKLTASYLNKRSAFTDRSLGKLKKKHDYYGQVQLGMFLLGLKNCDFVVFSDFDQSMAIERIAFDLSFTQEMVTKLIDVYFDIVLPWLVKNSSRFYFCN